MEDVKIVFYGSLPTLNQYTSANRYSRFAGGNMKKEGTRAIKKVVEDFVEKNGNSFEWPYYVHFTWFWKDKRSDPDNIAFAKKFIFDGMMEAGALSNDNWANILGFTDDFVVDKENPRVEIVFSKEKRK